MAYLALGWVIIQVTDVIVPALNLPDMIKSIVVYIWIIGFPIALFLAWAFELTPEGVRRTNDVSGDESIAKITGQKINYLIIGLLSIAVIFLLLEVKTGDTPVKDELQSIAVLPFVDMSEANDQEYFSDGLSEELLNVLAKIPDLNVAGRTSSFAYKGLNTDLREIGAALSVEHILEGSVRKQNNKVRITAQLIRTEDGFHIWSETYDRELSDIFQVQEDIAKAIVSNMALSMDLSLTHTLITTRTDNIAAYELLLKSKPLLATRGTENLRKALNFLTQATKIAPEYATAWGMLAQAHTLAYYYPDVETRFQGMFYAEDAAMKALRIDPNLSLAHGALGDILKDKNRWSESESQYILALKGDPKNAEANVQYAQLFLRLGRFEKSVELSEVSRLLDPLGMVYNLVSASSYYLLNMPQKSEELYKKTFEISNGTSVFPLGMRFVIGLGKDDLEESKSILKKLIQFNNIEGAPYFNESLVANLDDMDFLNRYLKEAYGIIDNNPEQLNKENVFATIVYAALAANIGNYSLALDFLELEANSTIEYINVDGLILHWASVFDPIQNDPRMKQIRRDYGFVDYWKVNGWADACRAVGDDDFECGIK